MNRIVTTDEMREKDSFLTNPAPLAMIALAVPLFVWSAFNAGYLGGISAEAFIIPLAVFFAAPVLGITAVLAYLRRDVFTASLAGLSAAFWLSYGLLLWLNHGGIVPADGAPGAMNNARGLLYAVWAISFGIVWLGSMRHHWALGLISLGFTAMFVLLSVGAYASNDTLINIGGWIGFVTAGVAWYTAFAEMINAEFESEILPTGTRWLHAHTD